tara:strand:- start:1489 stop:2046 length:558 start_codon:yes stop_codon:yes gene_type:complete
MSFSRTKYDEQCYINQNKKDDSINNYLLNAPENDCNDCFQANPEIRLQKKSGRENISIENDLFGIDRKDSCNNAFEGCVNGECKTQAFDISNQGEIENECSFNTINTRFDSVKNLKELSANRWQWLPIDPQNHAISTIDVMSSRNHIKDNHKSVYENPSDSTDELEFQKNIKNKFTVPVKITPFD